MPHDIFCLLFCRFVIETCRDNTKTHLQDQCNMSKVRFKCDKTDDRTTFCLLKTVHSFKDNNVVVYDTLGRLIYFFILLVCSVEIIICV